MRPNGPAAIGPGRPEKRTGGPPGRGGARRTGARPASDQGELVTVTRPQPRLSRLTWRARAKHWPNATRRTRSLDGFWDRSKAEGSGAL